MTLGWIIVPALFIAGVRAVQQQHRCHVCLSGTGSDVEVERVFPGAKLESCHRSSEVMVCPDNYKGCLTQSKGDQVMRTCAQLAVDACRWANGVEYCYCMGELCNTPPPRSVLPPTDDEDLADTLEGSGAQSEPPISKTASLPTTSLPFTTVTSTLASSGVVVETSFTLCVTSLVLVAVWR